MFLLAFDDGDRDDRRDRPRSGVPRAVPAAPGHRGPARGGRPRAGEVRRPAALDPARSPSWRASASVPRRSPSASTRRRCCSRTWSGSRRCPSASGAQRTVTLLNALVSRWDVLAAEAGVEKIKTIGDAYFAAAGVPEKQDDHARRIVDLGLAMIRVTADIGTLGRRAAGDPRRRPLRPGRRRRHREDEVQLRPVGRHGERGQPPRVERRPGRDPGGRRHRRPCWATRSRSCRAAR